MRRLLIRPGAVGDCILSFPALEHLKAGYTEVWCPATVAPLIHFADRVCPISSTGIDLLGIGDLKPAPELVARLKSFDSIVSWYGANRPEFYAALQQFGVPCVFHRALPPADYTGPAADFYNEQTGAALGAQPRILIDPSERRDSVVIHPFSGSVRKNWPLTSFRELASRLDLPVDWTAGREEPLVEAVRFNDLWQLARWMKAARLYIGNDSGITHLAAAIGMPTLAIFGPASPATWKPLGDNVMVLEADSLAGLSAQTVADAANRLLR